MGEWRVLLASADADALDRLSRILREARCKVVATRRSGRMLYRALDEPFDLAVLDLELEDLEGTEALQILRRARPELPVLVVSGAASERVKRLIQTEGAAYHFEKPLDYGAFANILRRMTQPSRSGPALERGPHPEGR